MYLIGKPCPKILFRLVYMLELLMEKMRTARYHRLISILCAFVYMLIYILYRYMLQVICVCITHAV